ASTDISRLHCAIVTHPDGRVFVRDYGSDTGTIVNHRILIGGEYEIQDNDVIELGPLVFRFHCQGEAASTVVSSRSATTAMPPVAPVVMPPAAPPRPHPVLPGLTTISSIPRTVHHDSALVDFPSEFSDSNIFSVNALKDLDPLEVEPASPPAPRRLDAGPRLVRD
ncbi:MAG TPA: FHA domain-containing protein, partial [Gemmatales bacterium]|nr:FHA domain-containing protein [Gemmatales bacterium]